MCLLPILPLGYDTFLYFMKILPSLCHAQLRGSVGRVGMIITTYSIGIGARGNEGACSKSQSQ